MLTRFAPAKINLYLHVTGRRADGYHFLDSLVAFADVGDRLWLDQAESFAFALEGPMATGLDQEPPANNLVVRAAENLAALTGRKLDVRLTLEKHLPTASGIGGGSTDAAATLRLLAEYWGFQGDDPLLLAVAAKLGQDVPCCVAARTCYFEGIGDVLREGPVLPPTFLVLVNPRQAVPTPAVFKARNGGFSPAAPLEKTPATVHELAELLAARSNDLTQAACSLLPEITKVLEAITASPSCLLARMSGSGATCFGLYPDKAAAHAAAAALKAAHPDWWIAPAFLPFHAEDGRIEAEGVE